MLSVKGSVARLGARVGMLWLPSARPSEGPHPKAPGQRHGHKQASNMADDWSGKGKVARDMLISYDGCKVG